MAAASHGDILDQFPIKKSGLGSNQRCTVLHIEDAGSYWLASRYICPRICPYRQQDRCNDACNQMCRSVMSSTFIDSTFIDSNLQDTSDVAKTHGDLINTHLSMSLCANSELQS